MHHPKAMRQLPIPARMRWSPWRCWLGGAEKCRYQQPHYFQVAVHARRPQRGGAIIVSTPVHQLASNLETLALDIVRTQHVLGNATATWQA